MRCPVCFSRDVDVLMKFENHHYSCLKCSYQGKESEIRDLYLDIQKKFKLISTRITLSDYENL